MNSITNSRAQITSFIILGIIILAIMSFFIYFSRPASTAEDIAGQASSLPLRLQPVKSFINLCLENTATEALILAGLQGGSIHPKGMATTYESVQVPYYLIGENAAYPSIEEVKQEISAYVKDDIEQCLNFRRLEELGFKIKAEEEAMAEVNINEEDVSVTLYKPLEVAYQNTVTKYSDFTTTLPIKLRQIHQKAITIANKIKIKNDKNEIYDITEDCSILYDADGTTNIYSKGYVIQIVEFGASEPYKPNFRQPYIFQFAIAGASFTGECKG